MAYANGTIPTSKLTPISARHHTHGTTAYLRADAAAGFLRLAAAYRARFGRTLTAMSFYRPIEDQIRIFKSRYVVRSGATRKATTSDRIWQGKVWRLTGSAVVATPGLSNHGLGTTVDFQGGIQHRGSVEHAWMRANGPAYGWDWTEGQKVNEPWHWTYMPGKDTQRTAGKHAAPANTSVAPAFPLPAGYTYGPASGPATQVSGTTRNTRVPGDVVRGADGRYYSRGLKRWQQRMKDRGWTINVTGRWDAQTERVALQSKRQWRGWQDPLIGAQTWPLAWTEPVR